MKRFTTLLFFIFIATGFNECAYLTVNNCNLRPGTKCTDVNLSGIPIPWTDLTGSDFSGANFSRANLSHTIFKNAILDRANFKDAIITDAVFAGASCIDITWTDGKKWADGRKEDGPCFANSSNPPPPPSPPPPKRCYIGPRANCPDDVFSYSSIQNTDLSESDFSRAQFENSNLTNSILTNAKLNHANFSYANLTNVKLTGANLDGANFTGAKVIGADFSNASCKNITWKNGKKLTDGGETGGPCHTKSPNPPPPPPPPTENKCTIKDTDTCYEIFARYTGSDRLIKKKYHELGKICHPDRNGDKKQVQKLNCCYEALLSGKPKEIDKCNTL